MLNKDNYVPWSSRLLHYAKSKPNGRLIYNSIMNGPYVRRMIPEPVKQMESDDQAIQIILMGLPKDIYAAAEVNELRAERLARAHDPLSLMANSNNPYNYPVFYQDQPSSITYMQQPQPNNNFISQPSFNTNYMQQPMPNPEDITYPTTAINMALVLMAKAFKLNYSTPTNNNQRILSNPRNRQIAQPGMNMVKRDYGSRQTDADGWRNQVVQNTVQNPEEQYTELLQPIPEPHQVQQNDINVISENNLTIEVEKVNTINHKLRETNADLTTELAKYKNQEKADKFVQDFKSLANEADESHAKHKDLEFEIERLLRAVVSQDIMSIVQNPTVIETSDLQTELEHILDPLSQKPENENVELEFQVLNYATENAHLKTTYKNLFDSISVTRAQTKTIIDSLQDKLHDTIYENAKLRAQLFDKTSEQKDTTKGLPQDPMRHMLVKTCHFNLYLAPLETNVVNDKVIAPGMFRINPFKTFREEKYVPNKPIKTSVRTKPITISQPHVITKKDVNSYSNGLSSTGIDNTAKTRRPQLRSNTNNDRVPSASKSSCSKNKEVEVEVHPRNLLLSKNEKQMSSECNNIKLAIRNDKSKVVYAMCKQCLINSNHDVCVLNYVNDMNSRVKKINANVSNTANKKKHKPKGWKPKTIGSKEKVALPKPRKPRTCLTWSPTGRIFDLKGKIIESSKSESQSDCSNDSGCSKHMIGNLKLINFVWKFLGTVCFGNDHVAAILGYGDLQWGNILITMVYFVEGLGHDLFLVGQFCDSDLEVAFRRNTCFVRNFKGVDLLKGNRTTNLYNINLHEMASASPICLMARATSTKSWLWHQCLSHLNFKTINELAKNDLVTSLPKFRYHKEHICPSYEYSRYTWVYFLISKDEAPEETKTFLKKLTVLRHIIQKSSASGIL
ncbi:retrovirus-related pol polyprotein from transposon TNT 1-94 [Tanacetum coccineum]